MPSGTVYGTSIGGTHNATIGSQATKYGAPLKIVRQFFGGLPGAAPSGLTTAMIYVPSFKGVATNYTGMAAGTWDSQIQTNLRSFGAGQTVWDCYYHEPEDNCQPEAKTGFTLAGWRAAAGHFNNLVHTTSGVVATVLACQIYMAFTLTGGKGRNINNYWDSTWDANHTPDLIGFDFDGITGYPDQSAAVAAAQAFATSKGIPWFVAEFGASPASTDSTHAARTAWNNTTAAKFAAAGAAAVAYWDSDAVWLSTSNEITAWGALVATAAPTNPAAPTGVTCTPAPAGTTAVVGWATLPGGVDHLDAYLQGPGQTYPRKINASPIPVTPRTYSFTTVPGTTYSPGVALVAVDSAGNRSGYSSFVVVAAPNPGAGGQNPIITSWSATQDATNPLLYHLAAAATSPPSRTLSYLWTFTYPSDSTVPPVTLATASGDVMLTAPGSWNGTLLVTDTSALSTPQALSVGTPAPSAFTPFLSLRMLQHTEDPRQMAFIDQEAKPLIDTWAQGVDGRQSPWNAKYGLAGSSFSADQISPTVVSAAASGVLMWWAFTLEDTSFSQLLFATSVAQSGTGAIVGVHDATGLLLGDFNGVPASGTDVDAGFASTAAYGIVVPLDLLVQNRTWGETLFGQAFWPSGMTTYPTLHCSAVPGAAAAIGQGATTPLWGIITGQSGYANNLAAVSGPFSLWAPANQIWAAAQ